MSDRQNGVSAVTHRHRSRSTDRLVAATGVERLASGQRCPSAPNLVDHESEMAFVMHRCSSGSNSSSHHSASKRIPPFNYHDGTNPPPSTAQATSAAAPKKGGVTPTVTTTTAAGPVEYGDVLQVTPPARLRTVPIGFLDDLVPQKGRRLRKHFNELEPFDGQCRFWTDSPLERIHPEQGCIPILKAVYFSRNNNDLDKENAHFKLAEALISTFELLKWKSCLNRTASDLSDWEVGSGPAGDSVGGGGSTRREGTEQTGRDADGTDTDESCEAIEAKESVYDERTYSAEEIAISLLGKFHDKQLPSACDFLWLVSEQDAPQKLLPMPSGGVIDPDEQQQAHEGAGTLIRGTQEWAPPRPQVIFTYRPPPLERRAQIQRQGNRCEGCGIKVHPAYLSRYRYCHYTGKYNCSGCHKNQMAIIPARVIQRWDFTVLPVSVFAYRVLGDIWSTPLYRVNHLYPDLYGSVKSLRAARLARVNVKYVKDFIMNCRHSESTRRCFQEVPEYFTSDFDMWSMADLLAVKSGTLQRLLLSIVSRCERHILACELCLGRGFVCEKCIGGRRQEPGVLFPWQPHVVRCEQCGTRYHDGCWRRDRSCEKCTRMQRRATDGAATEKRLAAAQRD
ncbi:run domain Beclin-1-interacting and cysteine-rich domain-containing protein [Anopheles gambiae]|uniref:Rubicon Homology domain-containing protein n=1 Tax=Anopheles coluzzii TaxID=1518534 RepID=A0A6E8W9X8_ANOCL|nr:run domain Beclin-1-interacting and cysteine-rich domain-containing protein [Anopheles coluzzii]XP_061514146.1 run domain Beclin-1-interacting and cysteine-rich domain-containing protein [Anopheles gambiae]